jgi:hypothetical protein
MAQQVITGGFACPRQSKLDQLMKAYKKRQDGASASEMYDILQPVPVYGDEGDGSKPLVGVKLKALCGKLLSASNVSVAHKNYRPSSSLLRYAKRSCRLQQDMHSCKVHSSPLLQLSCWGSTAATATLKPQM